MNRIIKIIVLFVAAGVLIGTPPYEPYVRNLAYEVIPGEDGNPGGGLKITWDEPYDAPYRGSGCWARPGDPEDWLYIIEVDGIGIDTTDQFEYYLYTPCLSVEVLSFDGEDSYANDWLDFGAVETRHVDVQSIFSEVVAPSAFGFDSYGYPWVYMVDLFVREDRIDYYLTIDDDNRPALTSPSIPVEPYDWLINEEENYTALQEGYYEDITVISDRWGFQLQQDINDDAEYGLKFIGEDSLLHYAKLYVKKLYEWEGGYSLEFRVACQPVPELRWVAVSP